MDKEPETLIDRDDKTGVYAAIIVVFCLLVSMLFCCLDNGSVIDEQKNTPVEQDVTLKFNTFRVLDFEHS